MNFSGCDRGWLVPDVATGKALKLADRGVLPRWRLGHATCSQARRLDSGFRAF